jgi:hypothetical protein
MSFVDRFLQWFASALILASALPLGAAAVARWSGGDSVTWRDITGHGQLLLIGAAIVAPAFVGLMASDAHARTRYLFATFVVLGLALMGVFYGQAAADAPPSGQHFVVKWSLIAYAVMVVVSFLAFAFTREVSE